VAKKAKCISRKETPQKKPLRRQAIHTSEEGPALPKAALRPVGANLLAKAIPTQPHILPTTPPFLYGTLSKSFAQFF
jgi:hypothetical protein